eukprot:198059_1
MMSHSKHGHSHSHRRKRSRPSTDWRNDHHDSRPVKRSKYSHHSSTAHGPSHHHSHHHNHHRMPSQHTRFQSTTHQNSNAIKDDCLLLGNKYRLIIIDIITMLIQTSKATTFQSIISALKKHECVTELNENFNHDEKLIEYKLRHALSIMNSKKVKDRILTKTSFGEYRPNKGNKKYAKLVRKQTKRDILKMNDNVSFVHISNAPPQEDEPDINTKLKSKIESEATDNASSNIKYKHTSNVKEEQLEEGAINTDNIEDIAYVGEGVSHGIDLTTDVNRSTLDENDDEYCRLRFCPVCKVKAYRSNKDIREKCAVVICYEEARHPGNKWVYWCWKCGGQIEERLVTLRTINGRHDPSAPRCKQCAALRRERVKSDKLKKEKQRKEKGQKSYYN